MPRGIPNKKAAKPKPKAAKTTRKTAARRKAK